MVPPKNLQEFHFLLADVLAEMTGATTAAVIRGVSSPLLPMLLMCTTPEDMRDYLARIGIHGFNAGSGEDEEALHADLFDDPEASFWSSACFGRTSRARVEELPALVQKGSTSATNRHHPDGV